MVIKFFSNTMGGSSASVKYLLNERVEQGTARVLSGDEKVTRALIDSMVNRQKTCVGCLAFTEKEHISEKQKEQIMKEFEYALMPGMKNRFNILWVEHTDKINLELNFVIPKIDLESGKSYNPYYHEVDFKRIETFQELINTKYDLSNPKEPIRQQNAKKLKFESIEAKNYKELEKILKELVAQGVIKSRDELIKECKKANIEITRQNEEGLSLKLPNAARAKKFKGGIYAEQFRGLESIAGEITDIETRQREFKQVHNSRNSEFIRELTAELNREKRRKFKFNRAKFGAKERQGNTELDRNNPKRNERELIQEPKNANGVQNKHYTDELFSGEFSSNNFNDNDLVEMDRAISSPQRNDNKNQEWQDIHIRTDERDLQSRWQNTNKDQVKNDDDDRRIDKSLREQITRADELMQNNAEQLQRFDDELQRARERLRKTRERLQNSNAEFKRENDRNTVFSGVYRDTKESFKRYVADRIREFKQQFGEHIKTKLERLREQSKRDIKSSLVGVKEFIDKNKRKLERVLQRDVGIGR